jgi:hypothetical protein
VTAPSIMLAQFMVGADGWEMKTDANGESFALHKASGLTLRAWGTPGLGLSVVTRDGERVVSCYSRDRNVGFTLAPMLDPIIAALTAARAQVKL